MYKRRISHLQQAHPADIKPCPAYIKDMPTIYKGLHLPYIKAYTYIYTDYVDIAQLAPKRLSVSGVHRLQR